MSRNTDEFVAMHERQAPPDPLVLRRWAWKLWPALTIRLATILGWLKVGSLLMSPILLHRFQIADLRVLIWIGICLFGNYLPTRLWSCPKCSLRFWSGPSWWPKYEYPHRCPKCEAALVPPQSPESRSPEHRG
jgi:hypothetical protein